MSQPLGLVRVVQHNLFREAELIDQQDQLQVLYIHRSKILHSSQHSLLLSLSLSLTHTHTHTGTLPSPPDTITKVTDSTNTTKHRRKNRSTFIQALYIYIYYYLPHRVYIQCNICTIQCDIVLVYMYHYVVLSSLFLCQALETTYRNLSSKLENFKVQYHEAFQLDSKCYIIEKCMSKI